jgi:Permease family
MYAGAVAVPLIIGRSLKLSSEQIAILVNADLFTCGVVTIIQLVGIGPFGDLLPIMMGVTVASVEPMLAVTRRAERCAYMACRPVVKQSAERLIVGFDHSLFGCKAVHAIGCRPPDGRSEDTPETRPFESRQVPDARATPNLRGRRCAFRDSHRSLQNCPPDQDHISTVGAAGLRAATLFLTAARTSSWKESHHLLALSKS